MTSRRNFQESSHLQLSLTEYLSSN
jgi:hypothetical protein